MKKKDWTRYFKQIELDRSDVKSVSINLNASDFEGTVHMTDVQLQEGNNVSGYIPHTKEMFRRERDDSGNMVKERHFNGVIRGDKKVIIPNRARYSSVVEAEEDIEGRITGGLDLTFEATQDMPANAFQFSYLHGIRNYNLGETLSEGDKFELLARTRETKINGRNVRKYYGGYKMSPRGAGRYQTTARGYDSSFNTQGSGYLLAEVDVWMLAEGGKRL